MVRTERRSDVLGCGDRIKYINVCYCDKCNNKVTELFELGDKEFCYDCAKEIVETKKLVSNTKLHCDCCGEKEDTLFEYIDGSFYCEYCIADNLYIDLEKVAV